MISLSLSLSFSLCVLVEEYTSTKDCIAARVGPRVEPGGHFLARISESHVLASTQRKGGLQIIPVRLPFLFEQLLKYAREDVHSYLPIRTATFKSKRDP